MEAIERYAVSQDWITLLLLLVLILLVVAKYSFTQRFAHFVMLFATDKYLLLKGKNANLFHPFNIIFFTINAISAALFIYLFYLTFNETPPARPGVLFLRIITAYTAFVLLKFSIEKILADIISVNKKINYYLFYKLSYRNFMAMVMLPVTILFIYVWEPTSLALYIFLGLILLMNFITLLSIFAKNRQYILTHSFYFILYLCALEIGPYYILYKLVTKLQGV
ncbi:MAG: DUF4271 domain-containing protein [Salinimicrobium sediminis]|uniref:DUF4271 domain-containing protein n=1 Tax=Salinimicrobium sediminis TaxID=1343891 RepID=A0A285X128_9FLAO|nr:DUF4271 domain-containing protein [Salinimicrobium sediminis]MDX1601813.1 DUF4271 domain-containing protein [Salinimicrobium sediminis]MDX1752482.1 DUF4271 domain-containing protein [Salinimicrobium sediminis]SOC79022.1 protein of unknown function [Salinimicrobium sediminis]